MKYMKKAFSVLISLLMLVAVFLPLIAAAASCSVSVSGASGKQGDVVTVNVNISSVALGSFVINLNYDNSKLEFVSVSKGTAASALENSTVNSVGPSQVRCTASTSDIYNTNVNGNTMSVKFRIIASSGSAALSTSGEAYEASGARVSTSFSGASVSISGGGGQVTPPPSTTVPPTQPTGKSANANLKSLSIQGRTTDGRLVGVAFSPAFSSSVISYNANVLSDISELVITATAEHANATVLSILKSYLKMDEGKNTTDITVKAENGTTKRYRITTIKAASGTTPVEATTEATTEGETVQTTVPQEESSAVELSTTTANSTTAQAVDAFGKNILKQVSNDVYIKLGVAFAVAAISFFGASICLFVSSKKRKSNDK